MRIGEDVCAAGVGAGTRVVGVWLIEEADADIGEVCGSLGPLRKGLKSQEGASFDAREPFVGVCWVADVDEADSVERKDRTEDCDGDILMPLNATVTDPLEGESSGGKSTTTRLGLSSMGAILVAITELRCELRLSELRYKEAVPFALPLDSRLRLAALDSGLSAKISRSNRSACN